MRACGEGRKPKPTALHLIHGTYLADRRDSLPEKPATAPSVWDEYLSLEDTPPPTDAQLSQEEREAIALAQMGWNVPPASSSSFLRGASVNGRLTKSVNVWLTVILTLTRERSGASSRVY